MGNDTQQNRFWTEDDSTEMLRLDAQCDAKHDECNGDIHQVDTFPVEVQLNGVQLFQIPEEGE